MLVVKLFRQPHRPGERLVLGSGKMSVGLKNVHLFLLLYLMYMYLPDNPTPRVILKGFRPALTVKTLIEPNNFADIRGCSTRTWPYA